MASEYGAEGVILGNIGAQGVPHTLKNFQYVKKFSVRKQAYTILYKKHNVVSKKT